jgi:hypothetical protein
MKPIHPLKFFSTHKFFGTKNYNGTRMGSFSNFSSWLNCGYQHLNHNSQKRLKLLIGHCDDQNT